MLKEKGKGITLVALVITIVILLILAGISISTLTNTGIFQKAKDAKKASENAEKEQKQTLSEYERELNKYTAQELTDDKINKVLSETENIVLKDANGNIFTLPAGFKVVVNDDTGNVKTVDKGIVIEDATDAATKGSQFVWVPVGKIYTDVEKVEANVKKIDLNRYTFDGGGIPTKQDENVVERYYSETADRKNTIAKNIQDFKMSVGTNMGYYIGRYEARKNSDEKITEVGTDIVWDNITQPTAAIKSQTMYNSSNFTSDLMNSYAWDTAILFLQNCGEKKYSRKTSANSYFANMGTNASNYTGTRDIQCNVFDMASNVFEWTTEMSSFPNEPCVYRGGNYHYAAYTSYRWNDGSSYANNGFGYRPILYINI